jgi:tRNA-dihydrouridine synthase
VIADLRRHVRTMTLVGNGDVKTPADARRMLETTGCDLVMIGRGALGNPWIFRSSREGRRRTRTNGATWCWTHFRRTLTFVGEPLAAVSQLPQAPRLVCAGLRGAAAFRAEVNQLVQPEQVELTVRRFFQQAGRTSPPEEQDVDYRAALG